MNFKMGQIVSYAYSKGESLILPAIEEFFGEKATEVAEAENKKVGELFSEWLIFDFKMPGGISVATEYFLKNPSNLNQKLMRELEQILSTQFYDLLEIMEINRGQWIKLYSFTKGKIIKVWDRMGSLTVMEEGAMTGRVAKIGGRWCLIGGDGIIIPRSTTPRHKRLLQQMKGGFRFTPKDTLKILLRDEPVNEPREAYSQKIIRAKRKKLETKFKTLSKKHAIEIGFKKVIEFVYQENYQTDFADMFKNLMKLGIPETVVMEQVKFFQDVWNFFPHKKLKGKCPMEMH